MDDGKIVISGLTKEQMEALPKRETELADGMMFHSCMLGPPYEKTKAEGDIMVVKNGKWVKLKDDK
ncbi:MAG TPA: hypothetical protein VGK47_04530 [Nitrososphaeraceae archaeon]